MKISTLLYYPTCLLLAQAFGFSQEIAGSSALPADAADTQQEIQQVEKLVPRLIDRGAALYLLAHDQAHLGYTEKAFTLLKECMSLEEGFDPEQDPAFASLKDTPRFRKLIDRVHQRYPKVHRAREAFTLAEKELIPEGLAANPAEDVLYMGSLNLRKIVKIARNGAVSDFVPSGKYQVGPICGLKVDLANDTLWANTCPDSGAGAELLHFDTTGKLVERFSPSTSGPHLFNDLVLRGKDEIYLTDSLANLVYRFDRKSHTFSQIAVCRPMYYPNGIAISDDGRMLYIADAFGILRVDLKENTSHEIDPGKSNTVSGADGLYFYRNSLIAVQNSLGMPRLVQFHLSRDGLGVRRTGVLEYRTPDVSLPTTGAIEGTWFYFMSNTQVDNFRNEKILNPGKLQPIRISAVQLED
jgi:hypothetical protein